MRKRISAIVIVFYFSYVSQAAMTSLEDVYGTVWTHAGYSKFDDHSFDDWGEDLTNENLAGNSSSSVLASWCSASSFVSLVIDNSQDGLRITGTESHDASKSIYDGTVSSSSGISLSLLFTVDEDSLWEIDVDLLYSNEGSSYEDVRISVHTKNGIVIDGRFYDNSPISSFDTCEYFAGVSYEIDIDIETFSGAGLSPSSGSLWFDVSLQPVPEPGTVLLAGLGGMALLRKRNK